MVHSLELTFDDAAGAAIIAEVNRLVAAGLRNPHRHQRPHLTLIAARSVEPAALSALGPVAQRLPITIRLGAPIVLSHGAAGAHGGYVLARSVIPTSELFSLHATVARLTAGFVDGEFGHSRPGEWTPHVTLARRLSDDQLAPALTLVSDNEVRQVVAAGIRRWDGEARTETLLAGRAC